MATHRLKSNPKNRKRILFINPNPRPGDRQKYHPTGLAGVMTAVQKAGFVFELFDMDAYGFTTTHLKQLLLENHYDIFAFGCTLGGFRQIGEISQTIRDANPLGVIIVGNSAATLAPELLLTRLPVDIAVLGEGEATTVELLQALDQHQPYHKIRGIAYVDDWGQVKKTSPRPPIADLDLLGFPRWDLFDMKPYSSTSGQDGRDGSPSKIMFPINTSRGCIYKCTHCYHVFKGQPFRRCSEESISAEFRRLCERFGATDVIFWDDLTLPTIKSVRQRVSNLEKHPFHINWQAASRGDLFKMEDVPLIERMSDTGCRQMYFSTDSANPAILRAMNKKIEIQRLVEHAQALVEGGITPRTGVTFGYPQETLESIRATFDLCREINVFPSVSFLQPLPGTRVYKGAVVQGYIQDEFDYLMQLGDSREMCINLTGIPTKEFISAVGEGLNFLAGRMGLSFEDPFKPDVFQAPKPKQDWADVMAAETKARRMEHQAPQS